MSSDPHRAALLTAFREAVRAGQPEEAFRRAAPPLPPPGPGGRTVILGLGKAGLGLARAALERVAGPVSGVVVVREDELPAGVPPLRVLGATHPTPSAASVQAGEALLGAVRGLTERDVVLALVSGGASALACAPRGVTLAQKADLTRALLASGADIAEINAVRKHLSKLKGGGLARAAFPARLVTLLVSDVVGDDPGVIGSGPTSPDGATYADALAVLDRSAVAAPEARAFLAAGARGEHPETPKAGDPLFARTETHLLASGRASLEAAAARLEELGYRAGIGDAEVTGPAREAARVHAGLARHLPPGSALLTGGETTTVVGAGGGRGGRNLEYLLALALALGPEAGLYALAADTDGIDGSSDAAGAVLTPDTLSRAAALGLDPRTFLDRSDAHGFFAALGDLIHTGPTGTNVNDFRLILRP